MHPDDHQQSLPEEDLSLIGTYTTATEAHEHGLVILSMGKPYWVWPSGEKFVLLSQNEAEPAIHSEISAYENERFTPQKRLPDEGSFRYSAGRPALATWILVMILSFIWQQNHPSVVDLGCSSSIGLIERGELWRPFTSLFLHSDAGHIAGNLLAGSFFGTLVARSIGSLRAWPMILASGTLGNIFTSLAHWPDPFQSIGASTAVFGALGILAGLGFRSLLNQRPHLTPARIAAPVIGGLAVLGLIGGGAPGGNTDVMGHCLGFLSGLALGFLTGYFRFAHADASCAGTWTAEHGERS